MHNVFQVEKMYVCQILARMVGLVLQIATQSKAFSASVCLDGVAMCAKVNIFPCKIQSDSAFLW